MKMIYRSLLLALTLMLGCVACTPENKPKYTPDPEVELTDEIDKWLYENFQKPYNCVVRWKWDDAFVSSSYYVSPPLREVMLPVGNMVLRYWIDPFLKTGGENFIRDHFPPEIVCVGSPLLNPDGSTTQGYAEAGVRITLTDLNSYDPDNKAWLLQQLSVIHHEFTHIIHQSHGLPEGFEDISLNNYTANAWVNLELEAAIALGMVTPYASSDKYEDFCELISHYLIMTEGEFRSTFLDLKSPDDGANEGRLMIARKLELALEYYNSNFGIDLSELRDLIQSRIRES